MNASHRAGDAASSLKAIARIALLSLALDHLGARRGERL
jgi:hypothetical protein